jgi:hypothetical protein
MAQPIYLPRNWRIKQLADHFHFVLIQEFQTGHEVVAGVTALAKTSIVAQAVVPVTVAVP